MEIITNKLLQKLSFNYSESLYDDFNDTSEIEQLIEQRELELSFNEFLLGNKELKKNYSKLPEIEQRLIYRLVELRSIFKKREEVIKEIKAQLKQCYNFIVSDTCKRNKVLFNEVTLEIQKLKHVVDTDWVSISVNLLNILVNLQQKNGQLVKSCCDF